MNRVNFKHISKFQMPEESPGFLFWRTSTKWRNSIEKILKPLHLTHPQFVVFAALGWLTRDKQLVSQVMISKMIDLDPNTTSQILRGLEAKKLIKRSQSVDERTKNPVLTELGIKLLSTALPAVEKADKAFFLVLKDNEILDLINYFAKLNSND